MDRFFQRNRTRFGLVVTLAALWLATPRHADLFLLGSFIALFGEAIRLWASGYIVKLDRVAVGGPYSMVRNPLYVGSFITAAGVALAGESLVCLALFLAFFCLVYPPTIRAEAQELEAKFGEEYRAYVRRVPQILPALLSYRTAPDEGFDAAVFRRNREWIGLVVWLIALVMIYLKFPAAR